MHSLPVVPPKPQCWFAASASQTRPRKVVPSTTNVPRPPGPAMCATPRGWSSMISGNRSAISHSNVLSFT